MPKTRKFGLRFVLGVLAFLHLSASILLYFFPDSILVFSAFTSGLEAQGDIRLLFVFRVLGLDAFFIGLLLLYAYFAPTRSRPVIAAIIILLALRAITSLIFFDLLSTGFHLGWGYVLAHSAVLIVLAILLAIWMPPPSDEISIQLFHQRFFNVLVEAFPSLMHLHYGFRIEGEADGFFGLVSRLREGSVEMLKKVADSSGMQDWPSDSKGLDLGCGLGGTSVFLAERFGFDMTGVNITTTQLHLAKERLAAQGRGNRVRLVGADGCSLPFADASFDFVIIIEVAFHISDKQALFSEIARVLRPGGQLVLIDQERRDGDLEALDLFYFVGEGAYRRKGETAGLDYIETVDLSAGIARWMTDYIRAAGRVLHLLVFLKAFLSGKPGLAWRYIEGIRYYNRIVLAEAVRRGIKVTLFSNGIKAFRELARRELLDGTAKYAIFRMKKPSAPPK